MARGGALGQVRGPARAAHVCTARPDRHWSTAEHRRQLQRHLSALSVGQSRS